MASFRGVVDGGMIVCTSACATQRPTALDHDCRWPSERCHRAQPTVPCINVANRKHQNCKTANQHQQYSRQACLAMVAVGVATDFGWPPPPPTLATPPGHAANHAHCPGRGGTIFQARRPTFTVSAASTWTSTYLTLLPKEGSHLRRSWHLKGSAHTGLSKNHALRPRQRV